jgi:hypothetical protein
VLNTRILLLYGFMPLYLKFGFVRVGSLCIESGFVLEYKS